MTGHCDLLTSKIMKAKCEGNFNTFNLQQTQHVHVYIIYILYYYILYIRRMTLFSRCTISELVFHLQKKPFSIYSFSFQFELSHSGTFTDSACLRKSFISRVENIVSRLVSTWLCTNLIEEYNIKDVLSLMFHLYHHKKKCQSHLSGLKLH